MRTLLLFSVLCLAAGLGLLFGYCHGSTALSFFTPLAVATVHIDVTASGIPALASVLLTLVGSAALVLAWLVALFRRSPRTFHEESEPGRRRGPFQE